MAAVAVLASARADGDAGALCDAVTAGRGITRIDLGALHIQDYTYGGAPDDDFGGVARQIADGDAVLLVTPVYWYAMSGVAKRFMDRLTDLVTVDKPLGRRLAGRGLWVAACGTEPAAPDGFEVPFQRTADYFEMAYGGLLYARASGGRLRLDTARTEAFGDAIASYTATPTAAR